MAGRRLLHGLDDTVDEGDAAFDDAISAARGLSNEAGHAATCWVVAVVFVGLAVLLLVWRVYRWGGCVRGCVSHTHVAERVVVFVATEMHAFSR